MTNRLKASDFLTPDAPKVRNVYLRDLKSFVYGVSDHPLAHTYRTFFAKKVLPLLTFTGYKQDAKRELAESLIYSLVIARHRDACVADTRDNNSGSDVRMRAAVWKLIESAGLAISCVGTESSGMVTRYFATKELMTLRQRWRLEELVDLDLEHNSQRNGNPISHALVYIHSGKLDPATGDLLPTKDHKLGIPLTGSEWWEEVEGHIEAFNANVLNFAWAVKMKDPITGKIRTLPLNPCLRELHCQGLYNAVRYYSWSWLSGQLLSKDERKTILIGGEQVAELDYSGCQLRMIYHFKGIDPAGDVYRPERIFRKSYKSASREVKDLLRGFVKRATLIYLNVKSRTAALGSIMKLLKEHKQSKELWGFIRAERPKTGIKGIMRRIVEAHDKPVADQFFTGHGLNLMTIEARIMNLMLRYFTRAKKPALMIHDAVVCRVSDVQFTQRVMDWAWRNTIKTCFHPLINREF